MNSTEALREFAETFLGDYDDYGDWIVYEDQYKKLTALISEHYTANEEVDKMVSERLREELIAYEKWKMATDGL